MPQEVRARIQNSDDYKLIALSSSFALDSLAKKGLRRLRFGSLLITSIRAAPLCILPLRRTDSCVVIIILACAVSYVSEAILPPGTLAVIFGPGRWQRRTKILIRLASYSGELRLDSVTGRAWWIGCSGMLRELASWDIAPHRLGRNIWGIWPQFASSGPTSEKASVRSAGLRIEIGMARFPLDRAPMIRMPVSRTVSPCYRVSVRMKS
jgi:hypothetical protein